MRSIFLAVTLCLTLSFGASLPVEAAAKVPPKTQKSTNKVVKTPPRPKSVPANFRPDSSDIIDDAEFRITHGKPLRKPACDEPFRRRRRGIRHQPQTVARKETIRIAHSYQLTISDDRPRLEVNRSWFPAKR